MHVTFGGREPTDPAAAAMRQLVYIACGYATVSAGAASVGAELLAIVLIGVIGLAHAALASWHGLKRGEQDLERLAAATRRTDARDDDADDRRFRSGNSSRTAGWLRLGGMVQRAREALQDLRHHRRPGR